MFLDQSTDVFVTLGKPHFVEDGVGAHIDEPPHFQTFFRQTRGPCNAKNNVSVCQQFFR